MARECRRRGLPAARRACSGLPSHICCDQARTMAAEVGVIRRKKDPCPFVGRHTSTLTGRTVHEGRLEQAMGSNERLEQVSRCVARHADHCSRSRQNHLRPRSARSHPGPCVRDVARVPDHSRLLRSGSPAAEVTKPSGSVVDALHPGTKVLEGIDGCHRPPVMPARSPVPGVSRHRRADRVS